MKKILCLLYITSVHYSHAALTPMDEKEMQQVNGQAGVTIETDTLFDIGEISYADDNQAVQMQDIQYGSQDDIRQGVLNTRVIDVLSDGSLQLNSVTAPASLSVGAIRINDSAASFGQFRLNYSAESNLRIGTPSSGHYFVEGRFDTNISDAEAKELLHEILVKRKSHAAVKMPKTKMRIFEKNQDNYKPHFQHAS